MYSDLADYYLRWYHSRPVAITGGRREELHRLHRVLMKCIDFFAQNYLRLVPEYMPLGDKEMQILDEQSRYPWRAGTFRPDYIVSSDGRLLLCEITSRFFAHGIFMSWFGETFISRFLAAAGECTEDAGAASRPFPKGPLPLPVPRVARPASSAPSPAAGFQEMMDYMLAIAGDAREMYVFKSADRSGEIRLYTRFYQSHGIKVTLIEAPEVEARRAEWDRPGVFLVSALNQVDILSYSMDTLKAMMQRGMYSDFRNIFLIHDKRFMSLWFNDEFTSQCLSPGETSFLRAHAIPTYVSLPPDVREHKDRYILKPCRLGKSEGVKAGVLCTEEEWNAVLDSGPASAMICQPFISQRTVPTVWEGTAFNDYLCGMMLCVNDRLFDCSHFRCSSLPVTNIGDDRKAAVLFTDDPALLKLCDVL
jgi:hypothetical protein